MRLRHKRNRILRGMEEQGRLFTEGLVRGMNNARLTQIEKRLGKATPGPWKVGFHDHLAAGCRCLSCHEEATGYYVDHESTLDCEENVAETPNDFGRPRTSCGEGPFLSWEDADFAAHAREDAPWLIARIRELEEKAHG